MSKNKLVTRRPDPKVPPAPYNQPPRYMHMRHLRMDVVEAAKARIRWMLENYDEYWISFSGGKDSLVVMALTEMVYEEMGITKPINVKFMDEELVSDDIIEFVQSIADTGRYNFRWYCLNMYVGFFVMGKHKPFVTWEKDRVWHRQPPDRDYVIYDVGADTRNCNENTISAFMYPDKTKTVAQVLGVRADESMKRFLAVSRGGNGDLPNYISTEAKHLFVAKPIYDWTEMDVFKFFKDYGVRYCPYYDTQVWAKAPLRVASALHERAIGQFLRLKELAPKFYEQLRSIYPEIETHYRYYSELSTSSGIEAYPHTFDGLRQYVKEKLDASHQKEALAVINGHETYRENCLKREPGTPLGRISVLQLANMIKGGKFAKAATTHMTITQADLDYEMGED